MHNLMAVGSGMLTMIAFSIANNLANLDEPVRDNLSSKKVICNYVERVAERSDPCELIHTTCSSNKTRATKKSEANDVRASDNRPKIQIAILLDNSGSMSGLIDQARTEVWKVINEFLSAEVNGIQPDLQVALYHYGNPPIQQLSGLTDDLDRVSEQLFAIGINGGSEHCGEVISKAVNGLHWSDSKDDLKIIFIAGNEPFTQGPIDYREACSDAVQRGIVVNTIHCGTGIPEDWQHGSILTSGTAMNIDHAQKAIHVDAPQDKEIAFLGIEINKTYIAFGSKGAEGLARQTAQDGNASQAASSAVNRGVAKGNAYYRNYSWDLCDACREQKVKLEDLEVEDLPENMKAMTMKERRAFVLKCQNERVEIQQRINKLYEQRKAFVAKKLKEIADEREEDTLDEAMARAVREQAARMGFRFEK